MPDRCAMPRCSRTNIELSYYGKPLCTRCWHRWAEKAKELKAKLKIKTGGLHARLSEV